ncbi:nicotinate-nucleotide--dimethylbenzimidazole phosphoribosyltransferase [Streptomyces sp. RFCAC02]|uniref:nicotinate-nucleotide--dimethylbenzimidazole phosphoribosyltransferase n=1 Tax=Streptomyces sp. RFCAC02 TaxID=2499143 RepID=UPI001F0E53C6|nr:nicotinate-nucleotide--dimethylbenzimidazole phosphoribosyltransferase [Streptomyces sp. RFCAC02]
MTDSGRLPEGGAQEQPGSRPGQNEQPVVPAAPFSFPGHPDEAVDADDEELLMPGAAGAWGDATVAPRPVTQAVPRPVAPRTAMPTEPEYLDVAAAAEAGAWQQQPAGGQQDAAAPTAVRPPAVAQPSVPEPVSAAPEPVPSVPEPVSAVPEPVPAPVSAAPEPVPAVPEPVPSVAEPVSAVPEPVPAPVPAVPEPVPSVAEPVHADAEPPAEPQAQRTPFVMPPAPAESVPQPQPQPVVPVAEPEPGDAAIAFAPAAPEPVPSAPEPVVPPAHEPPPAPEFAAGPVPAEQTAVAQETAAEPVGVPEPAPVAVPAPEATAAEAPVPEPAPAPVPQQQPDEQPEPDPAPVPPVVQVPAPRAPEPAPEQPAAPADPAPAAPATADTPRPPAPGYPASERDAVHRLMRERRDIRDGFRPDPIPHDVLLRVLEAAHTAPTAGLAQPWDFVIIRSEETRRAVHELAVRQRDAYAKSLPKARAKQFKELSVEAVLDTPVNIVVTADPTRGGRHTPGRDVQPQLSPYSSALAVENLWLAARAEGLGVGWVGFFDETELVSTLDLPGHLEIVAYLCVGYVDAFPEEPEPAAPGRGARRPLSWAVHEEAYGRRALPGAEPHDLLSETLAEIRPLDAQALGEAWERQKRMTKPAGALGALEIISAQLCGLSRSCPPPVPEPAAVAIFAGDHGVHAQAVTPWPQEVTAQMVANFLGGGAVCNAFAAQVGAEVCVVDVGVRGDLPGAPGLLPRKVRPGTGDITAGPAMSREEALRAVEVGIETARDLVAAGNRALLTGEMGIANTTVSAALIAAFTGAEPAEITGRGTGIDDDTHARKVDVVRRVLQLHQPDAADPIGTLAAVGGLEHAALTGFILGGASLRVPVILDGITAGAAALAARALSPEAVAVCVAGHRSAEPGHLAALTALGLRPLVDLDLRLGEGTGALLALPVVQSAARAMREVATFDSAGVTDKN